MTQEEKAKAYDEALKWMRELYPGLHGATKEDAEHFFPELRESEDERIIQNLIDAFTEYKKSGGVDFHGIEINTLLSWLEKQKEPENTSESVMAPSCWEVEQKESLKDFIDDFPYSEEQKNEQKKPLTPLAEALSNFLKNDFEFFARKEWDEAKWNEVMNTQATELQRLAYLEKQKEDKDELVYRLNGLMQDYIKEGKDDEEKEHRLKCYQLFWDALEDTNFFEQKEQKQTDLPAGFYYIDLNGNRYYSKEFRYGDMKLKVGEQKPAWSEDIIRKAIKEVGLTQHQIDWFKTNVFPPKQEWSEVDEKMLTDISWAIRYCAYDDKKKKRVHDWFINHLESLRPPFKPSEEQEEPEYYQHFDPDC